MLQGLPKGYTKKLVTLRLDNDATGKTVGRCRLPLNEPIYNVVYVDWVSVAHENTYATASVLLGKFISVNQFKNDGQFSRNPATGDGADFRYWAYIDSQSNQSSKTFPDDMFSPPINLYEIDIQVRTAHGTEVNLGNHQMIILEMWCKTS
jgi:hypothetical protein